MLKIILFIVEEDFVVLLHKMARARVQGEGREDNTKRLPKSLHHL